MIAYDLGDKCQAKSAPAWFGRHERIEYIGPQFFRNTGTGVVHADFERQCNAFAGSRNGQPDSRPECAGEQDLARLATLLDRLGRILCEVEKHLNQLVLVAKHGGSDGS